MSRADTPPQHTNHEDPKAIVEHHRETIEEAIKRDLPGSDRLKNLLTQYGGDE